MATAGAGCEEEATSSVPRVELEEPEPGENPIIRERYTADPAALVHDGRVWLYTGHDEPTWEDPFYRTDDWRLYSSQDLVKWEHHGPPVSERTFDGAVSDAWAS